MLEDQDPATARMADLSYAIASARAVVMALIAQDRDAAEEAALRTCRDCDLLIRLIRDLAAVLQTNDLNQLTCSQAELRWLARRAAYVLTFVGAQAPNARSPLSLSAHGDTGRDARLQAARLRHVAKSGSSADASCFLRAHRRLNRSAGSAHSCRWR